MSQSSGETHHIVMINTRLRWHTHTHTRYSTPKRCADSPQYHSSHPAYIQFDLTFTCQSLRPSREQHALKRTSMLGQKATEIIKMTVRVLNMFEIMHTGTGKRLKMKQEWIPGESTQSFLKMSIISIARSHPSVRGRGFCSKLAIFACKLNKVTWFY